MYVFLNSFLKEFVYVGFFEQWWILEILQFLSVFLKKLIMIFFFFGSLLNMIGSHYKIQRTYF